MATRRFAALLCLLALASAAQASSRIVGRVVRVEDGDSITVLDSAQRRQSVSLAGIAAPTLRQPSGNRAKTNLSALLLDQEVDVEWTSLDASGRLTGKVTVAPPSSPCHYQSSCPKTLDAALEQLQAGLAWWHPRTPGELPPADSAAYSQAELQAKIHRRGLWAETNPAPPWRRQ